MTEQVEMQTNLPRELRMSFVFLIIAGIVCLTSPGIGALITFLLCLGVFIQYWLSKKLSRIKVDIKTDKVSFEYVQLGKRTISRDKVMIRVTKRKEVHFRGGADEVFEIYDITTNTKIFELSKRSFSSEVDYKNFSDLFYNLGCGILEFLTNKISVMGQHNAESSQTDRRGLQQYCDCAYNKYRLKEQ